MSDFAPLRTEPFGQPDGAMGEFGASESGLIDIPERFGGIGRDPRDARIRVVVGPLGAGKSIFLRRMQDVQSHSNRSTYAADVQVGGDLSSEDIALFAKRMQVKDGNTEQWKALWRRAVIRSAASLLQTIPWLRESVDETILEEFRRYERLLGRPKTPRKVPHEVRQIINETRSGKELRAYLQDDAWEDIEYYLGEALSQSPPLFIYVDDIDKNYSWAPSLWTQCQRGLFYAVMDLLRDGRLRSRLHVVVAIRDVTMATVRASEHAPRYLDTTHINHLTWGRESVKFLLEGKLHTLPSRYFKDPLDRSISSWLGYERIHNTRPNPTEEAMDDYLVRHTRLVPRDLIIMGNKLCHELVLHGRDSLNQDRIRKVVGETSAELVQSQLALCANQLISDMLPSDAMEHEYDHVFLRPNDYALNDAKSHILTCIEEHGREILTWAEMKSIDNSARHLFGVDDLHLVDILWQQRLLGVLQDDSHAQFFDSSSHVGQSQMPKSSDRLRYVWNPMLFDIAPMMEPKLDLPVWPT